MKSISWKVGFAVVIGTTVIWSSTVVGALIPVANGSFEDPLNASFTAGAPTDWSTTLADPTTLGTLDDDAFGVTPPAVDGTQWLFMDERSGPGIIYQEVGVLQANSPYQLSFTIGTRSDIGLPTDVKLGLYAGPGATPVTELAVITNGDFDAGFVGGDGSAETQNIVVAFNSTGSPQVGENLFVGFETSAFATSVPQQILVDVVSLDLVPEPASLALLGLGTMLALRRRQK